MGSRYGGLKQIDPVGPSGETVLDYAVFDALRGGFGRIVFVIRRDFEAVFREAIGRKYAGRAEVDYVFQQPDRLPAGFAPPPGREKPWGTGHAVWCAADALPGPFAVINADDFYGADAFRQLGAFLSAAAPDARPAPAGMAGFRLANTLSEHGAVSRGVCAVDARGWLRAVVENTAIERAASGARQRNADGSVTAFTGEETVSMNCWGFTPAVLPPLGRLLREFLAARGGESKSEFYLPAAVSALVASGEVAVRVLPTDGAWFGVTYREDKPRVVAEIARLVRAGRYPEKLF